ncbi:hypothetical protein F511_04765 [Dorcoceras hygrometricum]|uniref:xyloglucan:xyloglucosyl transferase n=1 Tax=Dorcoceras hygrometricum TaxID=472368 RepID=A0A2Z7AUZ4_9LAMI|nr:hypothetical protein F511_04765 [Dorcoceras hygrometricum]
MDSSYNSSAFLTALIPLALCVAQVINVGAEAIKFDTNYVVRWGNDHVFTINQGRQVQLSLDKYSGAGFGSKLSYGSGFFHMKIKLPNKNSAGVVTAFYLTSNGKNHDELDFEFLGNREGRPITLQTNVFVHGQGNREQRIHLWFDPTADFHSYKILWNQYQIVFYVDNIPIRVFKNNTNIGVMYPTQGMQVEASVWNGDSWATDGGQTKTNWSNAPFAANFQGFDIGGCPLQQAASSAAHCYSSEAYWWNQNKFWKLDHNQQKALEDVRKKYMNYDYCADRPRYPKPPPDVGAEGIGATFDANYVVQWGNGHVFTNNQRREVQLTLDKNSGAGFGSKLEYGSGFFHMRIKLPGKDSAGVVTAFYLTSHERYGHDELDFEFLGNIEGKPITLQTNVFVNGQGNREQRIHLWFDPTADFHSYKIFWSQYQIVFYVDDIPIRVFNNITNLYPTKGMQIVASLWDADWASGGAKTNWAYAPFTATFQGFDIDGCTLPPATSSVAQCYESQNHWWNQDKFRRLDHIQLRKLEEVRTKYMYYDYCADRPRYPVPPPECV